jgi:predicted nucleic acid-binding protein
VTAFRGAGRSAISGGTVVDVSVAAAWCFEDEVSPFTEAVLDEVVRSGARVPMLWAFEVANVLAMAERRGRVDADRVAQFLEVMLALPVHFDQREVHELTPDLVRVTRIHRLTAYDSAYLDLALRTGLRLATSDVRLREAADRAGVTLFEA